MALNPREMGITREQVHGWLEEYDGAIEPSDEMRDFLTSRVSGLGLPDEYVRTPGASSRTDVTHIVEFILGDIGSYGSS
jgi:hypothetical protein